ncbi:MAG: ATP synthase F1 subunit gamma [Flavobacteriales bacterium]|nr:ATP synthase F1 subunit gamma [Flavobacteriales bacterium]MCB9167106.1 ATP synthase F1 subunit gamma [Flavobacteriales bacterium]
MPSLKEVRSRIASVNSTKQITAAMKMVSAAKLRRAQDAIVRMRPYAEKLGQIMANVSAGLDPTEGRYGQQRDVKRTLIVAITSNRGLAGAFNAQVVRLVKRRAAQAGGQVHVLSIGKKAMDQFKRTNWHTNELPTDLANLYDDLNFDRVAPVAELLMARFADGSYDRIVLVYNKFKNAATQIVTEEQFLPIAPINASTDAKEQATMSAEARRTKTEHIMEPDRATIVEQIIPKSLKIQLYKALLDSFAAEHGARMTAMHKATDNADGLLKDLRLSYNKARQAAITGEILEIVGGAEALKG